MATTADLYANGVRKRLKLYCATWIPNEPLCLGDVGFVEGDIFRRTTSLKKRGIKFEPREDDSPTPFSLFSERGVSMSFKAAGETSPLLPNVPQASAGIGISFARQGGFVIQANESYEPSIEDIQQLEEDVKGKLAMHQWRPEWAIVVKLVQMPYASILIAESSGVKVELVASGAAEVGLASLGDASIGFGIRSRDGAVIEMLGAKNITPIVQIARLKRRYIVGSRAFAMTRAGEMPYLTEPESADFRTAGAMMNASDETWPFYLDIDTYDDHQQP